MQNELDILIKFTKTYNTYIPSIICTKYTKLACWIYHTGFAGICE